MQIPRAESESSKAYRAKCDYLTMGPNRSISKLLSLYRATPDSAPSTTERSLKGWSIKYQWAALAAEYDEDESYRLAKKLSDNRKQEWLKELEEFRKIHNQLGRNSVAIVIKLSKRLAAWAETQPETPISPDDTTKALEVARVMQSMEKYMDLWGKSLCVDKLLDQLEGQ